MVEDERDRHIKEADKHTTMTMERLEKQFKQGMNPSKRRETQKPLGRLYASTPNTLKKNRQSRRRYEQVNPRWNSSTKTPGTEKSKPREPPSLGSPLPLKFFEKLHSPKAKNKASHLLTTSGGGRRKKRTKRKNRRKKKKRTKRKKRK